MRDPHAFFGRGEMATNLSHPIPPTPSSVDEYYWEARTLHSEV